jgi:small subunit ribosomal protein S2
MESQLKREKKKIQRNLEGVRKMEKLPGVMVVIDTKSEVTALKEARKLGIPTICLIDTDGDPEMADIAIPGNDDSMRSIDVVVRELCLAIAEGFQQREAKQMELQAANAANAQNNQGGNTMAGEAGAGGPRRSRRSQFRSDESAGGPEGGAGGAIVEPAAKA